MTKWREKQKEPQRSSFLIIEKSILNYWYTTAGILVSRVLCRLITLRLGYRYQMIRKYRMETRKGHLNHHRLMLPHSASRSYHLRLRSVGIGRYSQTS